MFYLPNQYAIAEFINGNVHEVQEVPLSWFTNDIYNECYWPELPGHKADCFVCLFVGLWTPIVCLLD